MKGFHGSLAPLETPERDRQLEPDQKKGLRRTRAFGQGRRLHFWDKLIDLTSPALKGFASTEKERLEEAIYPSPGGSDEFMKIFAHVCKIPRETLKDWQGRLTGLRDHGEKIALKLVRLEDLWKETRDAKALSAIALWDGLKRESRI